MRIIFNKNNINFDNFAAYFLSLRRKHHQEILTDEQPEDLKLSILEEQLKQAYNGNITIKRDTITFDFPDSELALSSMANGIKKITEFDKHQSPRRRVMKSPVVEELLPAEFTEGDMRDLDDK